MKFALIIPVFNHAASVGRVIADARCAVDQLPDPVPLILINDGSTDNTAEVLHSLEKSANLTLLTHPQNRGKGQALLTGFRHALDHGCTHAVTLDADGQHHCPDILRLLDVARHHPEDLIIGYRDLESAGTNVPARSKKGRDLATFWLRVQTGQQIPDSQCGLRVYPLKSTLAARYRFLRFDFETEVLARMAWAGLCIRSVPVKCIYFPANQRVSHFRPIIDTLRGIRVNVFLVLRRLAPLPFKRLAGEPPAIFKFDRWWSWQTWRDAIREMIRTGSTNAELATAFALGIFIGLTPFWGFHSLLVIYFGRRLHLNVVAGILGTQISAPPLVPVWLMLAYGLGSLVLHGHWARAHIHGLSRHMLPTFLVGDLLLALLMAFLSLLAVRFLLAWTRTDRVPAACEGVS